MKIGAKRVYWKVELTCNFEDPVALKDVRASIWCYRGRSPTPKMRYDEPSEQSIPFLHAGD